MLCCRFSSFLYFSLMAFMLMESSSFPCCSFFCSSSFYFRIPLSLLPVPNVCLPVGCLCSISSISPSFLAPPPLLTLSSAPLFSSSLHYFLLHLALRLSSLTASHVRSYLLFFSLGLFLLSFPSSSSSLLDLAPTTSHLFSFLLILFFPIFYY